MFNSADMIEYLMSNRDCAGSRMKAGVIIMLYCPYCGAKTKEDELFCTQCGNKIPNDIYNRMSKNKVNYRFWYIPLSLLIALFIAVGAYYLHLENQKTQAKQLFNEGEDYALNGNYQKALQSFSNALDLNPNFPSAEENKNFMNITIEIQGELSRVDYLIQEQNFQESLELLSNAEDRLKNYKGELVSNLVDEIVSNRKTTQLEHLNAQMEEDPSFEDLKTLLWQAEAIQIEQANVIADDIRNRIVSYAYSNANQQLKTHQFLNARDIIEDALKYAPESEKLKSLKTTIEKEKISFETEQQQRIEQAMSAAEEEREKNQNDAVSLGDIKISKDDQNNLVVSGKLTSVATVPINSISVEYVLLDEDDVELMANEVFVYPDTLYPGEQGNFDYTHFEIAPEDKDKQLKVKINKIKWFLD